MVQGPFYATFFCQPFHILLAYPSPQVYNPLAIIRGALAQLVERLHRTQQVRGSNPLCSTSTDGRQIFRESAACFIFTYGLAGYALPDCIPVGAKTDR